VSGRISQRIPSGSITVLHHYSQSVVF
jgi:hypothetical protein